jgi:hypothetical protein
MRKSVITRIWASIYHQSWIKHRDLQLTRTKKKRRKAHHEFTTLQIPSHKKPKQPQAPGPPGGPPGGGPQPGGGIFSFLNKSLYGPVSRDAIKLVIWWETIAVSHIYIKKGKESLRDKEGWNLKNNLGLASRKSHA